MNQRPSLVWQMLGEWFGVSVACRLVSRHNGTRRIVSGAGYDVQNRQAETMTYVRIGSDRIRNGALQNTPAASGE
jgi:hypothetical protein